MEITNISQLWGKGVHLVSANFSTDSVLREDPQSINQYVRKVFARCYMHWIAWCTWCPVQDGDATRLSVANILLSEQGAEG